jgi:putative flippase GtrA
MAEPSPHRIDRGLVREFLQFGLVGIGGTLVDLGALWVAINGLHAGEYLGRGISYLVAATFTWILNRRFTFRAAARGPLFKQWVGYLAVNASGAIVSLGVYGLIVAAGPHLGLIPKNWLPFLPYVADAIGGLCGMVFNFAGSKLLIFERVEQK